MYVRISRGQFNPAEDLSVQQDCRRGTDSAMQGLPGFEQYVGGANQPGHPVPFELLGQRSTRQLLA